MAQPCFRTPLAAGTGDASGAALVLHCSDARFQPPFRAFLRDGLGLDRYGLVAVPGGPHVLKVVDSLPKFSWVGWQWTDYLADLLRPHRIILIGHDDCRWYQDRLFVPGRGTSNDRQQDDLRRVVAAIGERFPSARAEVYFARFEGREVVFDRVE